MGMIRYWKRQERSTEGKENEQKYVAWEWETKGRHQKVPGTMQTRGSQELMGMTLGEIPQTGEMELA